MPSTRGSNRRRSTCRRFDRERRAEWDQRRAGAGRPDPRSPATRPLPRCLVLVPVRMLGRPRQCAGGGWLALEPAPQADPTRGRRGLVAHRGGESRRGEGAHCGQMIAPRRHAGPQPTPEDGVQVIAWLRRLRMTGPEIGEVGMATSTVPAVSERIGSASSHACPRPTECVAMKSSAPVSCDRQISTSELAVRPLLERRGDGVSGGVFRRAVDPRGDLTPRPAGSRSSRPASSRTIAVAVDGTTKRSGSSRNRPARSRSPVPLPGPSSPARVHPAI
jgi:hypothetical protein